MSRPLLGASRKKWARNFARRPSQGFATTGALGTHRVANGLRLVHVAEAPVLRRPPSETAAAA
eukprot:9437997-Alexandrium_andersonii.AAC.1